MFLQGIAAKRCYYTSLTILTRTALHCPTCRATVPKEISHEISSESRAKPAIPDILPANGTPPADKKIGMGQLGNLEYIWRHCVLSAHESPAPAAKIRCHQMHFRSESQKCVGGRRRHPSWTKGVGWAGPAHPTPLVQLGCLRRPPTGR